jgi:hypothetical protein
MAVADCIVASKMQGKGLGTSVQVPSEACFAGCPYPPYESVSRAVESATEADRVSLEKLPNEILTQVRNAPWPYSLTIQPLRLCSLYWLALPFTTQIFIYSDDPIDLLQVSRRIYSRCQKGHWHSMNM